MTIKRKLILSPALLLVLFVVITSITWISGINLTKQATIARAFERQAMHLQMLLRGVNETLLTEATPDSIQISQRATSQFEQTHQFLLSVVTDTTIKNEVSNKVENEWQFIKAELKPFLIEGIASSDNVEMMVAYGQILVHAEKLLATIQELSHHSQSIAEELAHKTTMLITVTVTAILLAIVILFFHLYRSIAQPISLLKSAMFKVSRDKHDLVGVIDEGSKLLGELEQTSSKNQENEIVSLAHTSRIMLSSIRNHLVKRKHAEAALSELNKSLEDRVDSRTHELRSINRQLQTQIEKRITGEQELRFAASIFDDTPDGIMVMDASYIILRVNDAFTKITGYSKESVIKSDIDQLKVMPNNESYRALVEQRLSGKDFWQGEIIKQRRNGETYPEWSKVRVIRDEQGKVTRIVYIFSDITEQKQLEEQLHQLAHYDSLTSLPNRSLFQERVQQALFHTQRRARSMAVLFLDLDHFKVINDSLGHQIGDELLELTAERLRECVRQDDTVARLGGDEFTILLKDINTPEDISKVSQKIITKISQPAVIKGHEIHTGTSIGISIYPDDGESVDVLLRNADTAMYRAKKDGKGVARFFTPEMDSVIQRRLSVETGLRKAVERDEFELHYQPQIDLKTGSVFGVEALLRWNSESLGSVPPNEFIPVAEEANLIGEIGKWVIEQACTQFKAWYDKGCAPERIGVNLSPRQLTAPNLLSDLKRILAGLNMSPSFLDLEITETAIMDNPDRSIDTLNKITELGIKTSIDDFGVEYSALNQLKRLSIQTLKIDRSFIRDIPEDPDDMAITAAIIAMAKTFGLNLIAEGVETKEQVDFLLQHDCRIVQGFYFSKPLPVMEVENLLLKANKQWMSVCGDRSS